MSREQCQEREIEYTADEIEKLRGYLKPYGDPGEMFGKWLEKTIEKKQDVKGVEPKYLLHPSHSFVGIMKTWEEFKAQLFEKQPDGSYANHQGQFLQQPLENMPMHVESHIYGGYARWRLDIGK